MSEDPIILTNGDALPEEVDGHLHALNRAQGEVAQAAGVMCQWLDYHAGDVAGWGPNETAAHDALHEKVVAYERLMSGGEE